MYYLISELGPHAPSPQFNLSSLAFQLPMFLWAVGETEVLGCYIAGYHIRLLAGYHMIAFSTDVPCCLLRFHLECTVSTLVGNRSYEVVCFTFVHSGGTPPYILYS